LRCGRESHNTEEALACYHHAFEVLKREMKPWVWAMAQHGMALAYVERVDGDRMANWTAAVACYRRALEVYTREASTQWWGP